MLATALANVDAQAQMATLHYMVGIVSFTEDATYPDSKQA